MKLILQAIKALFRKIEASIDRAQTTANNAKTLADSKMSAINPAGSGAFSMGRNPDSEIGSYSHAEGDGTTASATFSHAEGNLTTASGVCSHAEGRNTTASNDSSHAEGYGTTASATFSHAEGDLTTASGYSSHAEGYGTTASGIESHAEGYGTTASAAFSHAEGYYTSASGAYSHAEGKCNIKDTSNTYAHIVGNGSNNSNLSNAHTLDWSGNAWFQGDVYVGSNSGTNKDAGSKKLATEEYVDNKVSDFGGIQSPTTAEVGQTIVVKSVDETGKPTEWEAVDMDGGEKAWKYEKYVEFSEETAGFEFTAYDDGKPFDFTEIDVLVALKNAATTNVWGDLSICHDGVGKNNISGAALALGGTDSSVSIMVDIGEFYLCRIKGYIDTGIGVYGDITRQSSNLYVNSPHNNNMDIVRNIPNYVYNNNADLKGWIKLPTKFTKVYSNMTIGAGSSILIRGR